MTNAQVYRPWSGIALAAFVFLLCIAMIAGDWQNLGSWLWSAAILTAIWLVFVRPKLVIGDEGVTIVNPLETVTLCWDQVDALEVKYVLTFFVADRKVNSWVATGPGRYHARTIHKSELLGVGIDKRDIETGNIRPGESPRTASGQAIALCRLRWNAYRAALSEGKQVARVEASARYNLLGAGALVLTVLAGLAFNYFA